MPRRNSSRGGGRGQGNRRDLGKGRGCGQGMGSNGGRGTGYRMSWGRGNDNGTRQGLGECIALEIHTNPVEPPHVQSYSEHSGPEGMELESLDQEVDTLKVQADALKAQFQTINARISELQGGEVAAVTNVADVELPRTISNEMTGGRNVAIVAGEDCINCGICASVCPVEAITMCDIAVTDPQKCTGCGACVAECPNSAISLVELEEVKPC